MRLAAAVLHEGMHIFERMIDGRRYRIAAQSVWDPRAGRSVSRQAVLGPADPPPVADLGAVRAVGTRAVGDVGALVWVAEQLDLVGCIDRACGDVGSRQGPSVGEMVLAVAVQRACRPGPKRDLAAFLEGSVARVSCLPAARFTGQAFHRLASRVSEAELDRAQLALALAAVKRFELTTEVMAFDTTNFDTHIATTTSGELAQRGKAKSKRSDLRVVGLGVLVSETGHVPLMHRTHPGNTSDQKVLASCMSGLAELHEAINSQHGEGAGERTMVRDGGFWSPQLELELQDAGYGSIISLPTTHGAAKHVLQFAAGHRRMKRLRGDLKEVRAARLRSRVGELDRTLVVVESLTLLAGQKRGIAAALKKAAARLETLARRVSSGRIKRSELERSAKEALSKEHLATFVIVDIQGEENAPVFSWRVDPKARKRLEDTVLGRRVLCTDRHLWSTERIVAGFRGQWNVEELFRRAKGGGTVPWGPSYQWVDGSLRLHTFAAVIGLMLVALVRLALGADMPVNTMMERLAAVRATLLRVRTGKPGRPPTVLVPPEIDHLQRKAVRVFELDRWLPAISSASQTKHATSAQSIA